MLLTFPQVFTAKNLRKHVKNERDLEAHLRYKVYTTVVNNLTSRETIFLYTRPYTQTVIEIIKNELNDRGFKVITYIDMSTDKKRTGMKITY